MPADTPQPAPEPTLLQPEERVLSTLEADGSRRWIKPRVSAGRFLTRRRVVAYALIAVFTLIPYIPINGKPAILLDVVHRRFTLFGYTFLPTDSLLLALFMLGVLIGIFLLTALLGRVWCGWACPQTVYMEFVYRPIERLFEGTGGRGGKGKPVAGWRKVAQYLVYFVISFYLAHTFLAYFVGVANLRQWVFGSPLDHPLPFLIVMATTGMMMFDFAYFREQLCIVACPYGRLQSVLLDRKSLIVSYDPGRGEPRGKATKRRSDGATTGDCIDCHMCVATCPTGIDIRDGLQLECLHCAQCIDACDTVMGKVGKPHGLIRYSSQEAIDGAKPSILRPRVLLYPSILAIVVVLFTVTLAGRSAADVRLIREKGAPFLATADRVTNRMKLKITNRTDADAVYRVEVPGDSGVTAALDGGVMTVAPGRAVTAGLIFYADPSIFAGGSTNVPLRVYNDAGFDEHTTAHLLGPWSPKKD